MGGSEFTIFKNLRDMVPAPAGTAVATTMYASEDGILHTFGTTVPTDGTAGYAESCIFHKTGGSGSSLLYVNRGSDTSSLFIALGSQPFGTAAGRGPSPAIWDDCPVDEFKNNPEAGMIFFDDLLDGIDVATNQSAAAAAALGTTGKFGAFTGTTANTIASDATNSQGVAIVSTDTDNQSAMIVWPKGATIAGKVKFTTGKKLWMECRIKVSTIATAINQIFVGFAEEALNSEGLLLLINESSLADKDYVGFLKEYTDGDGLNTEFNTASGTNVSNDDEATLVAGAWTKLGIYCDGSTVTFYVDGVALATTTTTATADFPDGEEMAFYLQNMCGAAGTVGTVSLDWLRIAQEY
ncbi:MAG: hypothetical protein FVQ80_11050 [Planctomycetes bacterium]|nr:hypothetical protein [Planctomycetota bacterium]